jgi:hypothetical protein
METVEQVLARCLIDGNVIKLPPVQLGRKVYEQVARKLQGAGCKWHGGKVGGFVSPEPESAGDLLGRLQAGESVNLKKDFQFFPTPDELADHLVSFVPVGAGMKLLEPSAGQGSLVKALHRNWPNAGAVDCFELMPSNRRTLCTVPSAYIVGEDFLAAEPRPIYDLIIANPPFTGNQDIDHILRMVEWLAPDGCIATLASQSWVSGSQKKQAEFRAFVDKRACHRETVGHGVFKQSGTSVGAVLLVIR